MLYMIAFIAIALIGSGEYSLDTWLQKRKAKA
jgi:uncharacterized membrane protein YphA (DoxX/SURF4 family)